MIYASEKKSADNTLNVLKQVEASVPHLEYLYIPR